MTSWIAAHTEGWNPEAGEAAMVRVDRARFTVLTPRLVRMEWAPDGSMEDRASLAVVNRRLPVPDFRVEEEDGWIRVRTSDLELRWRLKGEGFTADTLGVQFRSGGMEGSWQPGDEPTGNLGGTARTLDAVDGALDLGLGVLSRDGWALVDDSATPLFAGADPLRVVPRAPGAVDWYLFAHGQDYTGALADFKAISGRIPLPPRWTFGVWWSRYWAYADEELKELVADFRAHEVPLDVLVVDMDWHETFDLVWGSGIKDQAGQPKGWTGYTWNTDLFPDPEGFLAWAHGEGLRVPLNLHPASGIQPWEAQYPAMARALGVDPDPGRYLPFRAEDPDFAQAYFRHVIHPLEAQGVDFWWLDWQQWSETRIPGLTPTMWLNHLFFTDMEARGLGRPVILHRFGGLGSHRYQVGFSGDAHSTWESLAFQPRFTATASNVLFGYWSHDIGGHEPGPVDPELYTRWVQFGVFSPVFRTHATKHPDAERRIWAFGPPHREAMVQAVRLRVALLPYLYTAAREAYDTGVSLVRPLYYEWPGLDEAYAPDGAYLFGPDLLVHPVTVPVDPDTGRATWATWLPPGRWVVWDTGMVVEGGRTVEEKYALEDVPIFVRAGAVIPLAADAPGTDAAARGPLVLWIMPGGDSVTRVYEDAGNDLGYQRGECAWRTVRTAWSPGGDAVDVTVEPLEGSYPGMPRNREIVLRLRARVEPGVESPCPVSVDFRVESQEAWITIGCEDPALPLSVRVLLSP